MSSPTNPELSPLLAAAAMAHGDEDGGGWLRFSEPDTGRTPQRADAREQGVSDWDRERWKEEWKQQWKQQWRRSKQQQQQKQLLPQGQQHRQHQHREHREHQRPAASDLLPRASESGGFAPEPLKFEKVDCRSESEIADFSPIASSDEHPSPSVRQAVRDLNRRASAGAEDAELVRGWSHLYRLTSAPADTCVEARGKKAQYEHYFKNKTEADDIAATNDPEEQSCGGVCHHVLRRVISDPWKWFTGVPISLMWSAFRCFLVASAVRSIVTCHLQWYIGEAIDYASVLETLVRLALVLNVAAGLDDWMIWWKEMWKLDSLMEGCSEGVKLAWTTLLRPACAPGMVLTILSIFAVTPATYFVGSKVRNWDWADNFVAATRLEPDQLAENIDAMKKNSTQGERATQQTEQLFFYGLGLSVELYIILWFLREWLDRQLRRLNALEHWKQLSGTFWDDVFAHAFRKYDVDRDKSITRGELELSVKAALGLNEDDQLSLEQQEAIEEMFNEGDIDLDGEVSLKEFTSLLKETLSKPGTNAHHMLRKHFDDAFDRSRNGYTAQIDIQYVMGMLEEHTEESFEKLSDIAAAMMEAAGRSSPDGITYEQWKTMMIRNDNTEHTNCRRKPCLHIPGAWYYHDAHAFVGSLLVWQWDISSNLPRITLPLPLILPVTFAPFVLWIWRLAQLCSALLQSDLSIDSAVPDVACEFDFFKFNISAVDGSIHKCASSVSRTLLGVDLSPRPMQFAGLPLTRWLKYLEEEVWNQLTESVLGTAAVLLTALWEYYQQRAFDHEEEVKRQKDKQDQEDNNLMSQVSFTLCLMEPVEENQETPSSPVFGQATLFEVKLKDLVKDRATYSEAIHSAADKTTMEYPFLHCLPPKMWKAIRGYILNELSGRFSGGYVAEELALRTTKAQFYFGLAHEPGKGTKKLRVIVASVTLLRRVRAMVQHGEEPKLKREYHKQRWQTVKNMSDLYFDKHNWDRASPPLRDIMLCLPADDRLPATSSSYSLHNERTVSQQSEPQPAHILPVSGRVAPQQRTPPASTSRLDYNS